ncbi:hypothetical protein EXU48_13320 [Occultella glacieicola]|uniref:Integral membrane protein n=1 Tax=Occultella glacieicola TaxID=2518684 RepID=A0ABY2E529_9MICO|nr:hypothetical protein [Occultella glacieicola]TDE92527.1 hypothetical protein EXU48_13320 [Occultella glacieicola]
MTMRKRCRTGRDGRPERVPVSVLELRVHGIGNTPPAVLLDLPPAEIQQSRGDALGSFWVPTTAASERDRALPPADVHAIRPDTRREAYSWGAMARLSAIPGWGLIGSLARGLIRVGWTVLVPFGLANVAYWTRRLPDASAGWRAGNGAASIRVFSLLLTLLFTASTASVTLGLLAGQCFPAAQSVAAPGVGTEVEVGLACAQLPGFLQALAGWEPGARTVVFALVPLAAVLALWLISLTGQVRYEERMSATYASRPDSDGSGIRGSGTVPVPPGESGPIPIAPRRVRPVVGPASGVPVLATPGFWGHRLLTVTTARLHLAAAAALLTAVLAWDGVLGPVAACRSLASVPTGACLDAGARLAGTRPLLTGLGALAVVVLAWTIARVCIGSEASPDVGSAGRTRRLQSGWLLLGALAVFGGALLVTWRSEDRQASAGYAGLEAVPVVLVAVLLGIAVAALGWRGGLRPGLWVPLLAIGTLGCGGFALLRGTADWAGLLLGGGILALLTLVAAVVVALRRPPGAGEGWSGGAPGVLLLLAAGAAMIFSTLVVLGTETFLNGSGPRAPFAVAAGSALMLPTAELAPIGDLARAQAGWPGALAAPQAYAEFGLATLVTLAVFVLAVIPPALRAVFGTRRVPGAPRTWTGPGTGPEAGTRDGTGNRNGTATRTGTATRNGTGTPNGTGRAGTGSAAGGDADARAGDGDRSGYGPAATQVERSRRVAAAIQRAEPVVGWLAGGAGLALVLTLLTRSPGLPGPPGGTGAAADGTADTSVVGVDLVGFALPPWALPADVTAWAVAAVGAAAVALLGAMLAGSIGGGARPLGILWDMICFLPRAAHPFGPPCYAERVVPELRGRIDAWFAPTPASDDPRDLVPPERRRVVLSAHSLGAVLAVAVLLARPRDAASARIGLLTYGTQVRGFFGRYFPELLGHPATGSPPCRAPSYVSADPWHRDAASPLEGGAGAHTLVALLRGPRPGEPAWVNLWRRTDPLGLPVHSYAGNEIDRGAEERDRAGYLFGVMAHSGYPRAYAYHRGLEEVLTRLSGDRSGTISGAHRRRRPGLGRTGERGRIS